MKFDIDGFKNSEFCVNCKTENEAKEFLSLLHHCGFIWANGASLLCETEWEEYQEDTYYVIGGTYIDSRICFGSINRLRTTDFPIIPFNEAVCKKMLKLILLN